jgi:GNAT superfamily N-acetyltransferase
VKAAQIPILVLLADRLSAHRRSDVGRMRDVTASPVANVLIEVAAPSDGAARSALWAYIDDVASRWYGRAATDEEIAAALLDDPSEDLAAPQGTFLVARRGEAVVGCAGLRLLADGVGEVKRVFVAPVARGHGLGRRLMLELEELARAHGLHTLRLDTRSDLVEARALYAALGYVEVPAFNNGQYAEHWFAKDLRAPTGQPEARNR